MEINNKQCADPALCTSTEEYLDGREVEEDGKEGDK